MLQFYFLLLGDPSFFFCFVLVFICGSKIKQKKKCNISCLLILHKISEVPSHLCLYEEFVSYRLTVKIHSCYELLLGDPPFFFCFLLVFICGNASSFFIKLIGLRLCIRKAFVVSSHGLRFIVAMSFVVASKKFKSRSIIEFEVRKI